MEIVIKSPQGEPIMSPIARDESRYTRVLMGEHHIRLRFDWDEAKPLPYGSYIEMQGRRWRIFASYSPTAREGRAEYDVAFHAPEIELGNFTCFYTSQDMLEAEWSLTGTLSQFAEVLRSNLERSRIGLSIRPTDYSDKTAKPLTFERQTMLDVVNKVAEAFGVDWWCEDSTLHFGKLPEGRTPLVARIGELASSFTPSGEGNPLISRLYAFGSERNLPKSYRQESASKSRIGKVRLQLPKPITHIDGVPSGIEHVEYFEDVYPRYEGTLSLVEGRTAGEDHIYKVKDTGLHIKTTYITEGQTLKARFTSGALQGMDFDLRILGDAYEVVPNDSYGVRLPNAVLRPAVGDKYVPYGFDISLVSMEYVLRAEVELKRQAEEWLARNNEDRRDVEMLCNPVWAYEQGVLVELGQAMRLVGAIPTGDKLGRVVKIEYPLHTPQMMTLTIGNTRPLSVLARLEAEAKSDSERAKDYAKEQSREAIRFTQRSLAEAEETFRGLLSVVGDNFGGELNPVAVRTMQLLAGDERLQYDFVVSATERTSTPFVFAYQADTKTLRSRGEQYLMHYTLPDKVLGASIDTARLKVWTIAPFLSPTLNEDDKPYYLYALCSKTTEAGRLAISTTKMSDTTDDYALLVGMLSSAKDGGERSFVTLYGFSEILPGRITTDRIVSASGATWFDLQQGHINGNISITDSNNNIIMGRLNKHKQANKNGGLVLSKSIGAVDSEGYLRSEINGDLSKAAFRAGISNDGTTANVEIQHEGSAKFGQAHINGATGEYSFSEEGGRSYMRIGGALRNVKNMIQEEYKEVHHNIPVTSESFNRSRKELRSSVEFSAQEGEIVRLSGRLTMTAGFIDSEMGSLGSSLRVRFRVIGRSGPARGYLKWDKTVESDTLEEELNETFVVTHSGAYELMIIVNFKPEEDYPGLGGTIQLTRGQISVITASQASEDIALTKEGMNVYYNRKQFFSIRRDITDGEAFLSVRGKTDLFGVLACGEIDGAGQTLWASGAKATTRSERSGGEQRYRYKIYHSIGHTRYSVSFQAIHSRDIPVVFERTASYVVVGFRYTGDWDINQTYAQTDGFTYTLCGDNA